MKKASFVLLFLLTIFSLLSCIKEELGKLPNVITIAPVDITETTIQMGGIITSEDDLIIFEYGACWDSLPNSTISDSKITIVPGIKTVDTLKFNAVITDLIAKTNYYFRAYATNAAGTAYGEELTICTRK
jgi:hypothetical protein